MVIKNPEHYFYACDGSALRGADEMLEWSRSSNDGSFYCHVNIERNDFAPWTKSILKDSVLAKKLEKIKTRDEMVDAIEKRLQSKSKKVKKSKKDIISQIKNAVAD